MYISEKNIKLKINETTCTAKFYALQGRLHTQFKYDINSRLQRKQIQGIRMSFAVNNCCNSEVTTIAMTSPAEQEPNGLPALPGVTAMIPLVGVSKSIN